MNHLSEKYLIGSYLFFTTSRMMMVMQGIMIPSVIMHVGVTDNHEEKKMSTGFSAVLITIDPNVVSLFFSSPFIYIWYFRYIQFEINTRYIFIYLFLNIFKCFYKGNVNFIFILSLINLII